MVYRFTAVTAAMLVAACGAMAQTKAPSSEPKPGQPAPKQQEKTPTLKVGDKAPPLSIEEWVKGEKIEQFEPGKVYIVEFWATWCGPCRAAIPHLTALQKDLKDKGVTIIGVAASERKPAKGDDNRLEVLKKFVRDQGDKMGYTVAYDADRSMSEAWMRAAGQGFIPTAFIVDKQGKIAWIGNPSNGLDAAVKAVLAGRRPEQPGQKGKNNAGAAAAGPRITLASFQPEQPKKKAADDAPAQPEMTLYVGDKAPDITVSKWVKGDPVTGFEKGKTYVVEFWATWCGPCRESIPHLTELQKAYKDKVRFIGVSVGEFNQADVEPFVQKMGDRMVYAVAMDDVPPLPEGVKPGSPEARDFAFDQGRMSRNWLTAAGQNSIPTAFVVGGDGRIAWIGHPNDRDDTLRTVLDQVVAGEWDVNKAAMDFKRERQAQRTMRPLQRKYQMAMQAGDFRDAVAVLDEIITLDPNVGGGWYAAMKFRILLRELKDYDRAYAYGAQIADGDIRDSAQALNLVAWTIVDPEGPDLKVRDLDLALRAARRAHELTKEKDPAITDTLAKVYHLMGDLDKALALQEKAASMSAGTQFDDEIKARLKQYREEAKARGG